MKKKISALLLSLALCAGLLAGCGAGETAEAPSDTDVQQVDSLKIAFSPYADADLISESTEPLEELLKAKLLEKGYDVGEIDMTVGTSYTAVGEALSAGSADIGFISGGNYVLFSDDCDVLLTALRYAINKDSENPDRLERRHHRGKHRGHEHLLPLYPAGRSQREGPGAALQGQRRGGADLG
ncbi:PhnD/SsuA/transferrin family substrate-binding protein [Oscillibacter sp.]|uniref:PhnD/SsuA/transferrin family substrate-binding protein n=1 Tax=Oscillibacter sp. TaxID=1945593 RepID=UPI00257E4E82|nr:PhnD/SsuA/transferrin family substrate-binding protein [Oscillibacter sp.]